MITPALLILSSASLVATALARLTRVIDRARRFLDMSEEEVVRNGYTDERIQVWMARYEHRAMLSERTVSAYFGAVCFLIAGCLGIAVDRWYHGAIPYVPEGLVILGLLLILYGSGLMLKEGRLGKCFDVNGFQSSPKAAARIGFYFFEKLLERRSLRKFKVRDPLQIPIHPVEPPALLVLDVLEFRNGFLMPLAWSTESLPELEEDDRVPLRAVAYLHSIPHLERNRIFSPPQQGVRRRQLIFGNRHHAGPPGEHPL